MQNLYMLPNIGWFINILKYFCWKLNSKIQFKETHKSILYCHEGDLEQDVRDKNIKTLMLNSRELLTKYIYQYLYSFNVLT